MNRFWVFLIVLTLFTTGCTDKATKNYNKGLREFEKEEYSLAIEHFQQAKKHGAPAKNVDHYLAESYRLSNRLHEAEEFYRTAIESGSTDEHVHFYYGYALKAKGNYEGAKRQFEKYVKNGSNFDYINQAKHELNNLAQLEEIRQKTTSFEVRNFEELNTDAIEYSPVIHNGGKELYFTSSRGEGITFPGQGTRFTDIYYLKFDGITPYSGQVTQLEPIINTDNRHEATVTFSPDGKTMIFSRSNNGKYNDPTQVVDLFESKLVNGEWTEPVRLSINERNSWDSAPCISRDGKVLYFSSNREGGFGANDIWKAYKRPDGTWGDVENMGPLVNSEGEDEFPYEAPNGSFFFSSDGHPGFGELDLFEVKTDRKGKKYVENMGSPINSEHDDFAITFKTDELGYFTSNRPGGKGDDDIYIFEVKIKQYLEVIVTGRLLDNEYNITDEEKILPGALVTVFDSTTLQRIGEFTTDEEAKLRFPAEPDHIYYMKASADSFFTNDKTYSMVGKAPTPEQIQHRKDLVYRTKIVLDPLVPNMKIELAPIYYPYDKWNITDSAAHVLDELVALMKENPDLKIELGSHTDPRNTLKYNDLLSQRRAVSAVNYILSHGISKDRIHPVGYGERVPLVLKEDIGPLKKGTELSHHYIKTLDPETQELAYGLDRRTEFTIVAEVPKDWDLDHVEVERHGEKEDVIEEEKQKHEAEIIDKLEHRNK